MSFFHIQWQNQKSIADYLAEISAAQSIGIAEVQLDDQIVRSCAADEVFKALRENQISWSILTTQAEFETIKNLVHGQPGFRYFNISFFRSEHIKIILTHKSEYNFRFVFAPNTTSDVIDTVKLFENHQHLYFNFRRYDPSDAYSLTIKEINKLVSQVKERFPDFEIKRSPFFSMEKSLSSSLLDSHPVHQVPAFIIGENKDQTVDFSFIIPTYNSNYFLLNVIKHILALPGTSHEIIVVDDGSTDDTEILLQSYLKDEDPQISLTYIHWPKPTQRPKDFFRAGLCRNLGANRAKGKYLIFLDSDILVPVNFLEDLRDRIKNHDVIQYVRKHIVPEKSNAHVSFNNIKKQDLYIEDHAYWSPFFNTTEWSKLPFFWKYTCTYCLVVSSTHFHKYGRFHNAFVSYGFEDTDLGYRLYKAGLRFHLSTLETLHLTKKPREYESKALAAYNRHVALSKTAKIFFLLHLDEDIYKHFIVFMGGESTFHRLIRKIKALFNKKK